MEKEKQVKTQKRDKITLKLLLRQLQLEKKFDVAIATKKKFGCKFKEVRRP